MHNIQFSFKLWNDEPIYTGYILSKYDNRNTIDSRVIGYILFCMKRYLRDNGLAPLTIDDIRLLDVAEVSTYTCEADYNLFVNCSTDNYQDDYFIFCKHKCMFHA